MDYLTSNFLSYFHLCNQDNDVAIVKKKKKKNNQEFWQHNMRLI